MTEQNPDITPDAPRDVIDKSKLIPVKIIDVTGPTALVEYIKDGVPERRFIPADQVEAAESYADTMAFDAGIPYGVDWENVVLEATSKMLADALRRNGIWTAQDIHKNPAVVLGCLQATYGVDLAKLLQYASEQKPKE